MKNILFYLMILTTFSSTKMSAQIYGYNSKFPFQHARKQAIKHSIRKEGYFDFYETSFTKPYKHKRIGLFFLQQSVGIADPIPLYYPILKFQSRIYVNNINYEKEDTSYIKRVEKRYKKVVDKFVKRYSKYGLYSEEELKTLRNVFMQQAGNMYISKRVE